MDQEPLILSGEETIATAARAMRERGVGALLVQQYGNLQGILTERDIVHKVVAAAVDPAAASVRETMTESPVTIRSDQDILEGLKLMRKHRIRRLPVTKGGQLVGLLTERGISQVAPELIQIAQEWTSITQGSENGYVAILTEEEEEDLRGVCEICSNLAPDLKEHDGSLHCEECLELATTAEPASSP